MSPIHSPASTKTKSLAFPSRSDAPQSLSSSKRPPSVASDRSSGTPARSEASSRTASMQSGASLKLRQPEQTTSGTRRPHQSPRYFEDLFSAVEQEEAEAKRKEMEATRSLCTMLLRCRQEWPERYREFNNGYGTFDLTTRSIEIARIFKAEKDQDVVDLRSRLLDTWENDLRASITRFFELAYRDDARNGKLTDRFPKMALTNMRNVTTELIRAKTRNGEWPNPGLECVKLVRPAACIAAQNVDAETLQKLEDLVGGINRDFRGKDRL